MSGIPPRREGGNLICENRRRRYRCASRCCARIHENLQVAVGPPTAIATRIVTVNQTIRAFPELARLLSGFTTSTRTRLSRSLVHSLRGHKHDSRSSLHDAVVDACHELQAQGLLDQGVLEFFSDLVEETGRACGADRPSLVSGELRWMPIRTDVLRFVTNALSAPLSLAG